VAEVHRDQRGVLPRQLSRADSEEAPPAPGGVSIVSIPPPLDHNQYWSLLYAELWNNGIRLEQGVEFTVNWLLSRRSSRPILHFHWPIREQSAVRNLRGALFDWWGTGRFALRLLVARALGYRVVWTVHEITRRSEGRSGDRVATWMLALASQLLIVHDETTAQRAHGLPAARRKLAIVPHPAYVDVYQRARPGAVVRRELGLAEARFVFLCFGNIRAYKDIPLLLEAFGGTRRELPDVALVIAGQPTDPDSVAATEAAAAADPRILPVLRFVENHEVADLFAAADASVYPRTDGGTSGSILLSLSLSSPVVAARQPAYVELLGEEDAGWLFAPGDPESLRDALIRAADPAIAAVRGLRGRERVAGRDWTSAGRRTAELMFSLVR
jgi:glycosyltransferase involved in cell wall biosynthesis